MYFSASHGILLLLGALFLVLASLFAYKRWAMAGWMTLGLACVCLGIVFMTAPRVLSSEQLESVVRAYYGSEEGDMETRRRQLDDVWRVPPYLREEMLVKDWMQLAKLWNVCDGISDGPVGCYSPPVDASLGDLQGLARDVLSDIVRGNTPQFLVPRPLPAASAP